MPSVNCIFLVVILHELTENTNNDGECKRREDEALQECYVLRTDFCPPRLLLTESVGAPFLTVTMRTLAFRLALWQIKCQIISMNFKVSP